MHDALRGLDLALKLVPAQASEWLRREFETLRQIRHENLTKVFDWGLTGAGEPFYTMELVPGGNWGSHMGAPQDRSSVLRIMTCVLRAVAHLHSHGQVHGDIKPSNVLVGPGGLVKLSDVGMTAGQDRLSGTPGYAAPEIWEGEPPSLRSDIYAAGIMTYEAFTGRHPFQGRTVREVVSGQLEGWVPAPVAHGVDLPIAVERAVMRAIERSPELRPASADEFLEALGVGDRVGAILGGRFIGRGEELEAIDRALLSEEIDRPTLIYVTGPIGIGKSALIEEACHRAIGAGVSVQVKSPPPPSALSSAAGELWHAGERNPVLVVMNLYPDLSGRAHVQALARYLKALALEAQRPSPVLILVEVEGNNSPLDDFELGLTLKPFSDGEVGLFLSGYLGNVRLEPEVTTWLLSMTGGVPGQATGLVADLVLEGNLYRERGTWEFRETSVLRQLERRSLEGHWEPGWRHIPREQQVVLAVLSLFLTGLEEAQVCPTLTGEGMLPELEARGWIRRDGIRWKLASEEARRAVSRLASRELTLLAERALLKTGHRLTREERAILLLRCESDVETVREGLWAAEQSLALGDHAAAMERAHVCLALAEKLGDGAAVEGALLLLARARLKLGDNGGATSCLMDTRLVRSLAERDYMLGVIRKSEGEFEAARDHYERAIARAGAEGDARVLLLAHAELAEIDWRHGDEVARGNAIQRVRRVLREFEKDQNATEERASLTYQLGSALIVAGNHREAIEVLESGLVLASGDNWRMRTANALATALYYLGEFGTALGWMDEAWRRAEAGGFDSFKARIFSNRAAIHYGQGEFRAALEDNNLSALWARRTGHTFEYAAALSGQAINMILLANYEEALTKAREAQTIAQRISDEYQLLKNLELEALARFRVGDLAASRVLVERAWRESERFGSVAVRPRLGLLNARLAVREDRMEEAERLLLEAESLLLHSRDWEDLPGVQIELELVRAKKGQVRSALSRILSIVEEAVRRRALIVEIGGAVTAGEIITENEMDDGEVASVLINALGKAERAAAEEEAWRLNHIIGVIAERSGDVRRAAARYGQAMRGLRVIADRLSAFHRECYLRTPHACRLLRRVT